VGDRRRAAVNAGLLKPVGKAGALQKWIDLQEWRE
jgi:hypothetical protein